MRKITYCMIVFGFLLIPVLAQADSVTINDTGTTAFYGGIANVTGWGDVIGPGFEVSTMAITRNGSAWTVVLTGDYFTQFQTSGTTPSGYGPGDLYINSNGWIAQGTAPNYEADTFSTSIENWDYVLTDPDGTGVKPYGIYTLKTDPVNNGYLDTNAPNGWGYRDQQAWRGGADQYFGTASSSLSGDTLTFTFNTGQNLWTDEVGFHWTMACGNDVVEGSIPAFAPPPEVPEPSTLLLLGLGLAGVAAYRKIKS